MNDGRRRRKAKQARRETRRQTTREPDSPEETPLLDEVRDALAGHPLELLGVVSVIIEATTPDPPAWLPSDDQRETVELQRLLDGFINVPNTETTALLAVLAELLEDAELRARCRQELTVRGNALPRWLTGLTDVHVYRAVRMAHAPGAGDEVLIGARLPDGQELTGAAFIDGSSAVKDAFVVPGAIDDVIRTATERNTDPDTRFVVLSLADARAWLEPGLKQPSLDRSDSWPACRPLLRWLTGRLPAGGTRAGE